LSHYHFVVARFVWSRDSGSFFVQSYVLISESYHIKPYILRDYGSNTCCYNNDGLFGHNCIGWIRQYKIQSEKHEIQ